MPVGPDPENLNIDAARVANALVVGAPGFVDVVGQTVGRGNGFIFDVNVLGEFATNRSVVRLFVVAGEANIFVEKKSLVVSKR